MKLLSSMKKLASAAVFLMLATLVYPYTAPVALAQATTGQIKGVVTDASGAVIADADVTAKEVATGVETKTKSNSEGLYVFPRLKPGSYLLTVQKQSFKKQEFQQVVVSIAQDTTIDVALQAGQITETVTVTAQGEELVQKEQVQISNTFESRRVAELPSNLAGNGIDTLALLVPGVVQSNAGVANTNGTEMSVNGNRPRSNNFTIDGGDNNDLSITGPAFFVNNQDVVGEFQVITNNFSAEYGRNQGAIVNIVTKACTNAYHGSAFEFHRNRNFLDSLTNIERRSGDLTGPPPLVYNVFGGTIGGPIKKDRIFFFGSYQEITDRRSQLAEGGSPTIAPEELSRLKAAFPNNPVVDLLANFSAFAIPFGTLSERTDRPQNDTVTIGGQTFRVAFPKRFFPRGNTEYEFSARGDVKINDKHSVWYRHLYQRDNNLNVVTLFTADPSNGFHGDAPGKTNYATANLTSQISTTAVNEFRFVFNRFEFIFGGGCNPGQKGCIPLASQLLQTNPIVGFSGLR